jgi:hypothetical protein
MQQVFRKVLLQPVLKPLGSLCRTGPISSFTAALQMEIEVLRSHITPAVALGLRISVHGGGRGQLPAIGSNFINAHMHFIGMQTVNLASSKDLKHHGACPTVQ